MEFFFKTRAIIIKLICICGILHIIWKNLQCKKQFMINLQQ